MKKILSLLLVIVLVMGVLPSALAADSSLSNFTAYRSYNNQFKDVKTTSWYYDGVKQAYNLGLVNGTSASAFTPDKNMSMAEIIALAAKMHSIFYTGDSSFAQGNPWYQVYVDYAKKNNFHPAKVDSYIRTATRAEVVSILAAAMPPRALSPINVIEDDAVPDVKMSDPYAAAIYQMYRAGILTGINSAGDFTPKSGIQRAEMVTLAARIADPGLRLKKNYYSAKTPILNSIDIATKCSDAVFYIELFSRSGYDYGSGSGFFITSDGMAVTNYHVIQGAAKAVVTTTNGKTYPVLGIYSVDMERDLAIIQVEGTGFKTLALGDPAKLKQGEEVYAIGSPLGLDNTFLDGKVSNPTRVFDDVPYIQISIPITYGSSGGALINTKGQVVGITTSGYDYSNMNFALPISMLADMDRIDYYEMGVRPGPKLYPGCTLSQTLESVTGAKRTGLAVYAGGSLTATYDKNSFSSDQEYQEAIDKYIAMMESTGMAVAAITGGWRLSCETESLELTINGDVIQVATTVLTKTFSDSGGILDFGWYAGVSPYWEYDDDDDGEVYHARYYEITERFDIFDLESWIEDYYVATIKAAGFTLEESYVDEGFYGEYFFKNKSGMVFDIYYYDFGYSVDVSIYYWNDSLW